MTTWFVKINNKYIPYATLELASKDLSEVFPIGTECVRHECSSLCGYFDCAEVEFEYAECCAALVGANDSSAPDKVQQLASLLHSIDETSYADKQERFDLEQRIENLLPTTEEMREANELVRVMKEQQQAYDEYLSSDEYKKADALASRDYTAQ